jgi:anti-sigma factor RsiW
LRITLADVKAPGCEEVLRLLSAYISVELPVEACREVEEHLADCSPCVAFAESLRKIVELCRHYRPAELPAAIGEEARERLLAAYGKTLAARKQAS